MHLGYFPDFKLGDIVLVSCDCAEIGKLRASLSQHFSRGAAVAIHEVASVSLRFPARLFVLPQGAAVNAINLDFVLRLRDNEYSDLDAKLKPLESVLAGHRYFPLPGTSSEIMVSVGEYTDEWWQEFA